MKTILMIKDRTKNLLILLLVAVYLASPVDVIPDVVPVAGWLDDVLLLLWAVLKIMESGDKGIRSFLGAVQGLLVVGVLLVILFLTLCVLLIMSLIK